MKSSKKIEQVETYKRIEFMVTKGTRAVYKQEGVKEFYRVKAKRMDAQVKSNENDSKKSWRKRK